jgi:hypothetical protein
MTADGKLKTSYEFNPKIKGRLMQLKVDLRTKGLTGVSESAILEALIAAAKIGELEAYFKRRMRS